MKMNSRQNKSKRAKPVMIPILFEFADATAVHVSIAGTFSDWKPMEKSMNALGNGHCDLNAALALGRHEYCLVVDGRWIPDPLARDYIPNPFGGRNSVINVKSRP